MESKPKPISVFKGGSTDHMRQLINEGVFYMNTIGYFRNLEYADRTMRHDRHEGSEYCKRADGAVLQVRMDQWREVGTIIGGMIIRDELLEKANILCLHTKTTANRECPSASMR